MKKLILLGMLGVLLPMGAAHGISVVKFKLKAARFAKKIENELATNLSSEAYAVRYDQLKKAVELRHTIFKTSKQDYDTLLQTFQRLQREFDAYVPPARKPQPTHNGLIRHADLDTFTWQDRPWCTYVGKLSDRRTYNKHAFKHSRKSWIYVAVPDGGMYSG